MHERTAEELHEGDVMNEPEIEISPDDRPLFQAKKHTPRATWPILGVIVLAALAGGGYYFWSLRRAAPPPAPAAPAVQAPPAPAAPQTSATPPVEHPLESSSAPPEPLPALADSDVTAQDALAGLFGAPAFTRLFYPEDIVRHFVAAIDNLPRHSVAQRVMPIKPVGGPFLVAGPEGRLVISPDNAARYTLYIRALESVDSSKLVAAYVRLYPLFQQAYAELGYPSRYFNDRVFEVIDDLLAAPEAPAQIALKQPKVMYEFADPNLESLSAGQKIMVRMGRDNEARVKAKLHEIKRLLSRG